MNHRAFGALGEREAENYLVARGAKVLARNWSCKAGELDLIVRLADTIVFVEVKTRTGEAYGAPAEAVNRAKQRHIRMAAEWYLRKAHQENARIRFDVIEVLDGRVRHIPGAF